MEDKIYDLEVIAYMDTDAYNRNIYDIPNKNVDMLNYIKENSTRYSTSERNVLFLKIIE